MTNVNTWLKVMACLEFVQGLDIRILKSWWILSTLKKNNNSNNNSVFALLQKVCFCVWYACLLKDSEYSYTVFNLFSDMPPSPTKLVSESLESWKLSAFPSHVETHVTSRNTFDNVRHKHFDLSTIPCRSLVAWFISEVVPPAFQKTNCSRFTKCCLCLVMVSHKKNINKTPPLFLPLILFFFLIFYTL